MGNLRFSLDFVISLWRLSGNWARGRHLMFLIEIQSWPASCNHLLVDMGMFQWVLGLQRFQFLYSLSTIFCLLSCRFIILFECGSLVSYGYSGFFFHFVPAMLDCLCIGTTIKFLAMWKFQLICTVTPASSNMEETHNTLKFASRAKRVEIYASRNKVGWS